MKSIKRALCSVLVCFGAFMFCTGTADAAEGADAVVAESADNNFVDNNVTDNLATEEIVCEQNVDLGTPVVLDQTTTVFDNVSAPLAAQTADTQLPELQPLEEAQVVVETGAADDSSEDKKETETKKKKKNKKKYNKADLRLLSCIISCESNNEPYAGKLAVGIVVMNRVKAKAFPNSVKGVIYQKSQFSPVRNGAMKRALARYDAGKFNSKNEKQCIKAAKEALDGVKVVTYSGKKKNMKTYHYFSGSLRGARYRISGHQFK